MRLQGCDYSQDGVYFVTTCTDQREELLCTIVDESVCLSDYGKVVQAAWHELPKHYPHVCLDAFVIMPNHVHAIVILTNEVGAGLRPAPTTHEESRHGLPEIVRAFKSFSAREINKMRGTPGAKVWQRGFYEHVIRDENDLDTMRQYIIDNPARWQPDHETATIRSRERLHP